MKVSIYDITGLDMTIDPKYDSIRNEKLIAELGLMVASMCACKEDEVDALLKMGRKLIRDELNRLLNVSTMFIKTAYFKELSAFLRLFSGLK